VSPPPAEPEDLVFDVVIVGSGVAGLSTAVRLASARPGMTIAVATKGELSASATRWAQGGVAAVLDATACAGSADPADSIDPADSTDLHLADTLRAGAGLCDERAVRVLVEEGPERVRELIDLGARFDRRPGGALALAREGGHSMARVVHAGGAATGAEVERTLVEAASATVPSVLERWFALDLVIEGGRCAGVTALDPSGRVVTIRATHTVLATGGAGRLFAVTTNPAESTADGIAMAIRAGVTVADVEFMQFHPTALHHPAMPRPLLSEALRGHGALLRDDRGERFVDELAPRDVVSRAMAERMALRGIDHLWLDVTPLDRFDERFPTIAESLSGLGLDPGKDWLPIAPAAHHLAGGVVTDLDGATELPGLWAVGEVACTGVHGANRLASNSLLEGMVFGARLAEAVLAGADGPRPTGVMGDLLAAFPPGHDDSSGRSDRPVLDDGLTGLLAGLLAVAPAGGGRAPDPVDDADVVKRLDALQRAMTEGAGVVRSATSLARAVTAVTSLAARPGPVRDQAGGELVNLTTTAAALLAAAVVRVETRGAHSRSDFPDTDPGWVRRIAVRRGALEILPASGAGAAPGSGGHAGSGGHTGSGGSDGTHDRVA